MDGSMAEGISTSFQTCTSFQPHDSEGLFPFENIPPPPSFSHLHVNDLGLTPSPGSQLQQPSDATRASSQHENISLSNKDGAPQEGLLVDKNASTRQTEGSLHGVEDTSQIRTSNQDTSSQDAQSLNFDGNNSFHTGDKMGLQNNLAQDAAKDIANALPDLNGPHNTEQLFYDPLFDSDFALRELESAFDSRKRTGDEAFPTEFDIWGPPEKRRILELPPNQSNTTPPGETPSLSSPNSSLRPDPVETAPHTPAGMERSQTPNSLFDTADPLFEDATFSIPFDMNFENVEERSGFENFDADLSNAIDAIERDPIPATYSDIADELPSLSDFTKHRFDLDAHDIAASTSRDILQRVDQEPQYLSPYPRYRGPLGYLPSAPGIHVRCIEVAEDQVNYRIENFKRKVQQLTHERNKYKTAWTQWTTVDSKTGKTKEQLLREENASLRRVSSQHQRRVEEYKTEAESWKGQLHNLATLYNNLLYEIQVQQKIPTIAPAPPGYKPRPAPVNHNAQMQYPAPNQQPSIPGQAPQSQLSQLQNAPETRPRPQTAVPNQQPTVPGSQPQGPPTNPRAEPRSETVTIDLTDDDTNAAPDSVRSSPAPKSGGPELLQSFRNKKYGWLGNDGQSTGRQSVTGASPVSGQENSQASTNSPLHNTQSVDADSNGDPAIDNDLTRTMEDELARG